MGSTKSYFERTKNEHKGTECTTRCKKPWSTHKVKKQGLTNNGSRGFKSQKPKIPNRVICISLTLKKKYESWKVKNKEKKKTWRENHSKQYLWREMKPFWSVKIWEMHSWGWSWRNTLVIGFIFVYDFEIGGWSTCYTQFEVPTTVPGAHRHAQHDIFLKP